MNIPSNRADARSLHSVGARATHFVGGCVAVALLVGAALPWSQRAEAPPTSTRSHGAPMRGTAAGLLAQGSEPTTRADESSRADRETIAASIASYDR